MNGAKNPAWLTFFELGKLYQLKTNAWCSQTSYERTSEADALRTEVVTTPGTIFMTLGVIETIGIASYQIKVLMQDKIYYAWFHAEWDPKECLRKFV